MIIIKAAKFSLSILPHYKIIKGCLSTVTKVNMYVQIIVVLIGGRLAWKTSC